MTNKLINLLKLMEDNKSNKITVPELGLNINVTDHIKTASLLLALLENSKFERKGFKNPYLNKDNVLKAYEHIERTCKEDIGYIGFFGNNSLDAFKYFKERWEELIIMQDDYQLYNSKDSIYVPIKLKGINLKDLGILSVLGTTIIYFGKNMSKIYINGENISYIPGMSIPLIKFIQHLGFKLDDFLMGELIYKLASRNREYKDLFIENLDCKFVQSLPDLFSASYLNYYPLKNKIYNEKDLEELNQMLDEVDFDRIKDFDYRFAKAFIYEKR